MAKITLEVIAKMLQNGFKRIHLHFDLMELQNELNELTKNSPNSKSEIYRLNLRIKKIELLLSKKLKL